MQTTERKRTRIEQDNLFQRAEENGLTLVRMKTRTEPQAWTVFATSKIDLNKMAAQRVAVLKTPREVEIFLMAYETCVTHLTA